MAKWEYAVYKNHQGKARIQVVSVKERQAIADGINSKFDKTVARIQKSAEIEVDNSWECACFDALGELGWEMVTCFGEVTLGISTVTFKRPLWTSPNDPLHIPGVKDCVT